MKILFPVGLVLALIAGGAIGWFSAMKKTGGGAAATGLAGDPSQVQLFQLDGKTFTMSDLPTELRNTVYESQAAAHERLEGQIKEFALRLALARAKDSSVAVDNLPPLQELLTGTPPSDEEIQKFYEENKARLPPNVTFDQIKGQLGQFMMRQKMMEGMQAQLKDLEAGGRLKMLLPEPPSPKVNLDLAGYPARGPEGAKTTLVEASDYLCPHCRETQPEVEALLKDMGDDIRFVQVNFALRPDGLSGALARGGYCAHKQSADIFWKYHEAAFKVPLDEAAKNDPANDKTVTAGVAKEAGANEEQFASCYDSEEARNFVQGSITKMNQAGVTGTPTFFLNNRKVSAHGKPLKDLVSGAMAGG